ncbi:MULTISPECIES: hypothetical protein [Bacillaceae]|nr:MULTISPECIES: hypothetical protein [Bacillaceae]
MPIKSNHFTFITQTVDFKDKNISVVVKEANQPNLTLIVEGIIEATK